MAVKFIREEAARCLLCYDAPCTAACNKNANPSGFVRALRFDNISGSIAVLGNCGDGCNADCEKACVRYDGGIRITELRDKVIADGYFSSPVPDVSVSTQMCGVKCDNPFFLSSSVVASGYDMCANALQTGWAGIVYKTYGTFVPDEASPRFFPNGKEGTPFIGFRNIEQISDKPLEENLNILSRLKKEFPTKVIVGSIMGRDEEEWTYLAKRSEKAGCDIIECNFSCPHMTGGGLGADVGTHPELVAAYTKAVRRGTKLPILAKMTPNVTNMEEPALAAIKAGADGIAAINTIKSITDIDPHTLTSQPSVGGKSSVSGYSGKAVKPIALRFVHDLKTHPIISAYPLSGIGGIETWKDALDFILLGCENVQVTTAVMQYGYGIVKDMIDGLKRYMADVNANSVSELIGKALPNILPAEKLDRATIEYPKMNKEECIGCGRCFVSCNDAGHQAIAFDSLSRKPSLRASKCVGCHLCLYVCPVGAITHGNRIIKPKIKFNKESGYGTISASTLEV